ncbi:MAG: GntR family transcriptional regulator [Proteobacteria bacterium]|nr:GntR family transcriptional regulator [Pseudomonadota bacterium]MBI3499195.1 GntR family transcriptional regulator [Pseudomonadota bacterium]
MHTDQQILDTFRLESSGVPIYVQIREQMLRAIGAGRMQPGQQMPTMRQVAVALRVDLNTVRHAYDELERAGAITILRARGSFVAERPPPLDPIREAARLNDLAHQAIAGAAALGVDPARLGRRIIDIAAKKAGGQ